MAANLRIGMIGLDTSHVDAFTSVFNDPECEYHIPDAPVVMAYPGGSPDFELSIGRVEGYTELAQERGVEIVDTPFAVAEQVDAVIMTAVDGRVHRDLFAQIVDTGKPTYIDKPFAVSSADARWIVETAAAKTVPVMSASSLRYEPDLVAALAETDEGAVEGCDFFGPMEIEPTQPGLYWYGIHTVEMVYAAMGRGCVRVRAVTDAHRDTVIGEWGDGRCAVIRGSRTGNNSFGGLLHRESGSRFVQSGIGKPKYVCLLDRVIDFFRTGQPDVDPSETVETIRFIEAANESRETGEPVTL